jgi:hypothetical protein
MMPIILTRITSTGTIKLNPPGLQLDIAGSGLPPCTAPA